MHRLSQLESPPASASLTASEALAFPTVQLFVEHAAASLGKFELDDADAPLAAKICRSLDGNPLGWTTDSPDGRDFEAVFQVTGREGVASADPADVPGNDTADTAIDLGDLSTASRARVEGAIGDDPFYSPSSPEPTAWNPAGIWGWCRSCSR